MSAIIVEGTDKCGKSTCIAHLTSRMGYRSMHFGKPMGSNAQERAHFQWGDFQRAFAFMAALQGQPVRICMDRAHLGELVYGPLYRSHSGVDLGYIHELESSAPFDNVLLILLEHGDLDVLRSRDDGLGFNINRLADERELFRAAFAASRLKHKVKIDVTRLGIEQMIQRLAVIVNMHELMLGMQQTGGASVPVL
jgi:thymidylate kinase